MAQAVNHLHMTLMQLHMDSQILMLANTHTKPFQCAQKKHFIHLFVVFLVHSICIIHIAHTCRRTRTHTHALMQDTVSSSVWPFPAVSSAKFNQALLFTVAMVLWWCRQKLN